VDLAGKQRLAAVAARMSGDDSVSAGFVVDRLFEPRVKQADVDRMLAWAHDASTAKSINVPEGSPPPRSDRSGRAQSLPPAGLTPQPNASAQRGQLMGVFLQYSKLTTGDSVAVHLSAARSIAEATMSLQQWLVLAMTAGLLHSNRSSLHCGRSLYTEQTSKGNRGGATYREFRQMLFRLAVLRFESDDESSEQKYRRAVTCIIMQPVPDCLPDWAIRSCRTRSAEKLSQPPRCYHAAAKGRAGGIDTDGVSRLFAYYSQESGVMTLSNWKALCENSGMVHAACDDSRSRSPCQGSLRNKVRMAEVISTFETETRLKLSTAITAASRPEGLTLVGFRRVISRMAVLCCEYSTSGHRQSPSEATSLLLKHILRIHAMKLGPSSDEADVHPLTTSKLASFHRQQLSSWQSMGDDEFFDVIVGSLRVHAEQAQSLAHEATEHAKREEQKMRAVLAWECRTTAREQGSKNGEDDGNDDEEVVADEAREGAAHHVGSASDIDDASPRAAVKAASKMLAEWEEEEEEDAGW
jgi:hypothetical protein